MNKTKWSVCHAFIDKRAKEMKESFIPFLSPKQQEEISSLSPCYLDLTFGFDQVQHLLSWCHHSWFAPFLRTLSEKEIPLFLSALPEEKGKELADNLLFSSPLIKLSTASKAFFQKKMVEILLKDSPDLPPVEALPASPSNVLLELSSPQLSLLIDFLGLYDLASEMRLIIDTIKIKKIQAILSKEQVFFLSLLSGKREPQLFKQLGLNSWSGEEKELTDLLHKRGMNRLAKALYPEDPNFIYYIKLHMSSDQATLFSSLHKKTEQDKTYKILAGQIADILAFFKKYNLQAPL